MPSGGPAVSSLWRLRDVRLILAGVGTSLLGDAVLTTGLLWYALEQTGSAAAMSGVPLVSSLVLLAVMPAGGVWLDTHDRRRAMIGADLFRAGCLALFLLPLAGATFLPGTILPWGGDLPWGAVLVLVALLALGSAVFEPGVGSVLPNLVPASLLAQANSAYWTVRNVARFSGPAVGGWLLARSGIGGVILLDLVTFLVSSAALAAVRAPFQKSFQRSGSPSGSVPPSRDPASGGPWTRLIEGVRFVRDDRLVRATVGVAATANLAITLLTVSLPAVVARQLHGGSEVYGLLQGAFQAGMAASGALLGIAGLARRLPNHSGSIGVSLLLMALTQGPFGWMPTAGSAGALAAVAGGALVLTSTLTDTRMQLAAPDPLRGRVWSLTQSLSGALRPAGSLAAGVLADVAFPGAATALSGILLGGLALWVWGTRGLDGRPSVDASQPG
ncbi:MFS transporter [Limnochorda pilosa]|uniref:MFS transporter n=1 Tax=Limnochorda pilosa TaxID=1555112 RepID=A0A0K2SLC2_LIMPI|nr:MFS transporter [Limnochorda pilosa]